MTIRAKSPEPRSRVPAWLAWLPLVVVGLLLAHSAITATTGMPSAAAAASTIDVTGLVDKYVYLDATGCSTPASLDLGDVVPDDPWKRAGSDCSILFGSSNSALGADLTMLEDPAAPASPPGAMKCVVASCSGSELDDVAPASTPPTGNTSAFGIQLESATGTATSGWTIGAAYPVAATQTPCSTAAIGDGTCAFRFGASADINDGPGAYQAQVQFLVLAR